MYKVKIAKKAQKEFKKIPKTYKDKISDAIRELATKPTPSGVRKMKGVGGAVNRYRIRVADYRIIYDVDGVEMVILVIKVSHRKQVYRKF